MDLKMLVRLFVVDSFHFLHQQDVVHLDVLQNLDEQILDEHQPYLDVALRLVDVVVGEVLRHQLRTDYFLDVVGEEQLHQLRTDCYLDVAQQVLLALQVSLHLPVKLLLLQRLRDFLGQPFQHHVKL
jgi:hypothetical protein